MRVTVEKEGPAGAVIVVSDEDTDSLARIEIKRGLLGSDTFVAKTVLRGNLDVRQRPATTTWTSIKAPKVSADVLKVRRAKWYADHCLTDPKATIVWVLEDQFHGLRGVYGTKSKAAKMLTPALFELGWRIKEKKLDG